MQIQDLVELTGRLWQILEKTARMRMGCQGQRIALLKALLDPAILKGLQPRRGKGRHTSRLQIAVLDQLLA